jgi:predicted ATPase/class 3 adenylate cyclase
MVNNLYSTSESGAPALTLAQLVAAYLPENSVVELINFTLNNHSDQPFYPRSREFEAVAMLVDITGFTPLCEALAKKGDEGAEQVSELINSFFTQALRLVRQQGGVIAKFGGDAFNAFFERQPQESWDLASGRALHTAFALQKLIESYEGLRLPGKPGEEEQIFRLYAKVGLGAGTILTFGVGQPDTYRDFQMVGAPFNQAAEAEHKANRGEVVVHNSLLNRLENIRDYLQLGEQRETCYELRAFEAPPPPSLSAEFGLTDLPLDILDYFIAQAAPFVPQAVYKRLKLGYQSLPGEHRRVASLFVNFRGFAWMEDPTAPDNFDAYYCAVLEVVQHYGGHLSRISSGDKGDLLHIMFGAPVSHEDDEARALRCALALQEVAQSFGCIAAQKIGLSSGSVFAGEIGSPHRHEYTIMGDTVNLSARLMQMATDWTVLLDTATAARLRSQFEFATPRPVRLKGKQGFVEVCEVLQANQPNQAGKDPATLTPIYGRDLELGLATAASYEALAGQSRVLAISGEPGIGKSFLVAKIAERWEAAGGRACRVTTLNHERGAFKLWAKWLTELLGLDSSADLATRQYQLFQAVKEAAPELVRWLPLWGELLDLVGSEISVLRYLDGATRQQRLVEYTPQLIAALAQRQPLMLVCDDFQWADSASIELLDKVMPRLKDTPLLLCVAYRSEEPPRTGLLELQQCLELALSALSLEASQEFIRTSLSDKTVNESERLRFVSQVNEMTGGNPFFIEELLSTLRAENLLDAAIKGAGSSTPLSYNLHSLIMARLDALESWLREVVLAASVVGGEFSEETIRPLLPPVVAQSLNNQDSSPLRQLHELDLLKPVRDNPNQAGVYSFRHALIQQVAYDSLPFARRRILHEEIALFFETRPERDNRLERLAYHYERSNNDLKAIYYLARSAERSSRLFANQEALQQYQSALKKALRLEVPADPGLADLLRALGDVQAQMADFPAALESYVQALEKTTDRLERVRLEQRRAEVLIRATRFDESLEAISQAEMELEEIRATNPPTNYLNKVKIAWAQLAELYSTILNRQGNYEAARLIAEDGLHLLQGRVSRKEEAILAKVKLYQALVSIYAVLRQLPEAQQAVSQGLRQARRLKDPVLEGQLQTRLAILYMQSGRYRRATPLFEKAQPIVEKTGSKDHLAYVLLPGGENLLMWGKLERAQQWLERGLQLAEEAESAFLICSAHYLLGRVAKEIGQWQKALEHYSKSSKMAQELGLWGRVPEYLSREGELLSLLGQHAQAEQLIRQALECSETYNLPVSARYFYFRPILAQIYLNQGAFGQALECLQESKQNFTGKHELNELYLWVHIGEYFALSTLNGQGSNALGSGTEILEQAKHTLSHLKTVEMRLLLPEAYRILGLLEWSLGRAAEAQLYFKQGLKHARKSAQALDIARLLYCRGEALGQGRQASRDKKEGLAIYQGLGLPPELQGLR